MPAPAGPIDADRRTLLIRSAAVLLLATRTTAARAGRPDAAAPVAETATSALPPLPLEEIAEGVHVHCGVHETFNQANAGDISNCTVLIGEESVALIDTSGSYHIGKRLQVAISELTEKPVRYVVNTHMHPDHVFGNAAFFGDSTEFVAHHKMHRGLTARSERYLSLANELIGPENFAGTEIVLPTRQIAEPATLDLGNRTLELIPFATAHTDNDLIVIDTKTRTLITGDLIFSGHIPTLDGSLIGWQQALTRLNAMPADRLVPGHGPATLPLDEAISPVRGYLDAVATDVRAAIAQGKPLAETVRSAAREEAAKWLLAEEFHGRTVSAAYAELEWE